GLGGGCGRRGSGLADDRLHGVSVDEDRLTDEFDRVARQPDDPFDVVGSRFFRKLEHDDIPASNLSVWEQLREDSAMGSVSKLVDDQVIADEERFFHRRTRHYEGLKQEGSREEREADR